MFLLFTTGAVSLAATITSDINSATLKFDHDYLHEYTFAQAGDVMFICHPLFVPQQLIRTVTFYISGRAFYFFSKSRC